jgi:hypothetical protein
LIGGSPIREMEITKDEISTRRTGWRSVVKAITGAIKTTLKLEILRSFPQHELLDMIVLPDIIIYPRCALALMKSYKEFITIRSLKNDLTINTSLHNLIEVKTLCRCIDSPDILLPLASYWKE